MPFSSSAEPALPAAWTDVLDRIQHVLADVLHAAEERARALEEWPLENASTLRGVSEGGLHGNASDPGENSKKLAEETEQVLAAAQEALDLWLATAGQVRQRLAELATRAI
jgi:hypothetical protein